jgi:sporulation protein YlmC with PRC-barrel domain
LIKIKYELQVVNNPESKIKNNLAGQCIYKNSGKELGRLFQLTNNYKGYRRLKAILEVGLEKVEKLLVESMHVEM